MKEGQTLWSRDELILAINIYFKLPFGKLHRNTAEVKHLAKLIGRTTNSVSYKLVNLASLDPTLKARGIKGASNASKLDKQIWNEFYNNMDACVFESEKLLAKFEHKPLESKIPVGEDLLILKEGKEKEQLIKVRVNQSFFRDMILASYNETCCITGLNQRPLLVASHISPWSSDKTNRLNPQNGLCLNSLHDKAFDNFLITVTPDYKIKISSKLKKQSRSESIIQSFLQYEGKEITLPNKFLPNQEFLLEHNKKFNERN